MNLTFDWEVTTSNKGNPFDKSNKAVCIGLKRNSEETQCLFSFESVQQILNEADLLIGFNIKFDLHWLRRCGFEFASKRIYCTQLAEFVLSGQTIRFPSLEDTAQKYGLGHKVDVIRKTTYWSQGINTDSIPEQILSDYCKQDVDLTYAIYLKQLEQFQQKPQLFKLFKLLCQDLLVLEEMEWNGLVYSKALCEERSKELQTEIKQLQQQLDSIHPGIRINWGSGDQLSSVLYGGTIYENAKELIGTYKTGMKAGQPKYKNIVIEHQLPRLVEPLKGSELKKEGKNANGEVIKYYKTDEGTLRKLKGPAAKKFVGLLLRLAEIQKLDGTYYSGLPALAEQMNWKEGMIHGQLNQCVAQTGRLSSSSPNLQNLAGACLDVFTSRYE